jgi:preprotein translocase subunit SecF
MIQIFKDVRIDWLANRRVFIAISVLLMLGGLFSAIIRQATGHQAFNLGVDYKGGTVVTDKFKQSPADEAIRSALAQQNVRDAIVQATDKQDTVLIKLPLEGTSASEVETGRTHVR